MKTGFVFEASGTQEAVGSVLYEDHLKRIAASRLAEFGGYLMPLWFSSIQEEHRAVRTTAGLFDCTHMGALGFSGPDALGFINTVTTNNAENMSIGQARYAYVLDMQGNILDDIIVYRRGQDDFFWIVNAGNTPKIKAYLQALLSEELMGDYPSDAFAHKPDCQDLSDSLVDIALQGPRSLDLLRTVMDQPGEDPQTLKPFRFLEGSIRRVPCVIARTGYTGAKQGFELLVSPEKASDLWTLLLEEGEAFGVLPCGLGARDSLRIEAGLPLYGHELAGQFQINPFEAGYGWAVKMDKPFFIGKAAMEKASQQVNMQVVRLALPGGRGIRPVREHDPVLNEQGVCIGWILSSAACAEHRRSGENRQIALAYIDRDQADEGRTIGVYYLARSQSQIKQGRRQEVEKSASVNTDITGHIIARFEKF